MIKNDYIIRRERKEDHREVENLVREAFWNTFRPGCMEHYLLHILRDNADFVDELDFVMEKDGRIIGQNVFVKANIRADDGRDMVRFCWIIALKRLPKWALALSVLTAI